MLWLAGALFLVIHILAHTLRIRRVIQGTPASDDAGLQNLLDDCQREMGTNRSIRVIVSDKIDSPALFGLMRPHLLLPSQLLEGQNFESLRYVFLHEIAHLRRYDILMGIVGSALHVLHWFNPLIGYGFKRMYADRELACDQFVMSRLHPREIHAYGHTIVGQFEQVRLARSCPLTIGFLGGRAQIKERIAAICSFERETSHWPPLAICLLAVLACTGLTDTHKPQAYGELPQTASEQPEVPIAPPAKTYAHAIRVQMRHLETDLYLVTDGHAVTCDASDPGNAGLWEARFNGSLGHGGDVLLYSVTHDGYLTCDSEGHLTLSHVPLTTGSNWIVLARPQGVWIISEDHAHYYLRSDNQSPVNAAAMGRDEFSYWDVIQLDRSTESQQDSNIQ